MIDNCRTGYFQFDARQDGLYFIVYPPKDGNRPVNIEDVLYYIDKKKINCDTVKLGQGFIFTFLCPFYFFSYNRKSHNMQMIMIDRFPVFLC